LNQPIESPEDAHERGHIEGRRSAYRSLLGQIAVELGVETTEGQLAALLAERMDVVASLRQACTDHGDNDWPDNLHLRDVIDKHLVCYLDEDEE